MAISCDLERSGVPAAGPERINEAVSVSVSRKCASSRLAVLAAVMAVIGPSCDFIRHIRSNPEQDKKCRTMLDSHPYSGLVPVSEARDCSDFFDRTGITDGIQDWSEKRHKVCSPRAFKDMDPVTQDLIVSDSQERGNEKFRKEMTDGKTLFVAAGCAEEDIDAAVIIAGILRDMALVPIVAPSSAPAATTGTPDGGSPDGGGRAIAK